MSREGREAEAEQLREMYAASAKASAQEEREAERQARRSDKRAFRDRQLSVLERIAFALELRPENFDSLVAQLRQALSVMGDEQRVDILYLIFEGYCTSCGSSSCKDKTCERDE